MSYYYYLFHFRSFISAMILLFYLFILSIYLLQNLTSKELEKNNWNKN